ncbi:hypothetical protein OsI_15688 [Oryza sativa Indica Group]|jgi:hypothetical protein|uniref:Uncharacterized protein n=4 Tax=Oryza TaxID=4527 RepID=B9FEX5_ORYSJ|nr:hypothetical protein OsI_15688 [Oryza sativa Indica Group]EEE60908.1 hypothetical protein OsJ_14605 [Oryza sativa Japonica Group]KAF2933726.1 hypothetical protein DAI22_04g108750 [Oryza sativa Japonica Group]
MEHSTGSIHELHDDSSSADSGSKPSMTKLAAEGKKQAQGDDQGKEDHAGTTTLPQRSRLRSYVIGLIQFALLAVVQYYYLELMARHRGTNDLFCNLFACSHYILIISLILGKLKDDA